MSCHVMLCYVMLCYVMLCYVMLCYAMLCCVMLCYKALPDGRYCTNNQCSSGFMIIKRKALALALC